MVLLAATACYPAFDWRDHRPSCDLYWCGFVASFPGRVTSAARDVPIDGRPMRLALHVVSTDGLTFAVGVFDLGPDGDERARAAQQAFEKKLLDDVGATEARKSAIALRASDGTALAGVAFEAEGRHGDQAVAAVARFVRRRDRSIEILVLGPGSRLASAEGRQAVETFLTSLRID